MELMKSVVNKIKPLDESALMMAAERLDKLIKPIGSLGRLEKLAVKISGITGGINNSIKKKCIIVMASDNGICEEGVSTSPQEITAMQVVNMTKGLAGISVLCKHAFSDLFVVDIGIKHEYSCEDIINKKIRKRNMEFFKRTCND